MSILLRRESPVNVHSCLPVLPSAPVALPRFPSRPAGSAATARVVGLPLMSHICPDCETAVGVRLVVRRGQRLTLLADCGACGLRCWRVRCTWAQLGARYVLGGVFYGLLALAWWGMVVFAFLGGGQ